ncbi:MAG: protease complex subunit PrcB family protein [Fimbriimonadaceae bacterium]|nr:protease complex subunit PrcB family protein [Fimbriimonadaceae bacterium]QYK56740.1 MAG: protease complex subunit PrcB family protein [Fimbriimonadaceae bacterium]
MVLSLAFALALTPQQQGHSHHGSSKLVEVVTGDRAPGVKKDVVVARNEKEWQKLSDDLGLGEEQLSNLAGEDGPLHGLNWNKEAIVFARDKKERPSGGFKLEFYKVSWNAKSWTVEFKLKKPGPDDLVTQALTRPFAVVRVQPMGAGGDPQIVVHEE